MSDLMTLSPQSHDGTRVAVLKLLEPKVSTLDSLLALVRDQASLTRREMLARAIDIGGEAWSLNQLLQDLELLAEDDDHPEQDCKASKALLRSLQESESYRRESS